MITHPELNSKVDLMIGLAPAASVANTKSLLRHTAAYVNPIEVIKQHNMNSLLIFTGPAFSACNQSVVLITHCCVISSRFYG